MADLLGEAGKKAAMEGIEAVVAGMLLCDSSGTTITSASVTTSDLTVETDGTLKNTAAIDFTITAGMVGETASMIKLIDGSGTPLLLIQVDLDSTVSLTTAGTATIAIGDFTADL